MTDRQARTRRSTDRGRLVAERIRQARIAQRLSQKELGGLYGCSAAAISQLERDATGIGVERLEGLARILGRPLYWFLDDRGVSETRYHPHPIASLHETQRWLSRFVPIYGRVVVAGTVEPVDWIAASHTENPAQLRAYEIRGLSHEPEVQEGDTILVNVAAPPQSGDVILGVAHGAEVLGRCEEGEDRRKSYRDANTEYSGDVFQVVGVVVRVSRSVVQREIDYDKGTAEPSSRSWHYGAPHPVLVVTYQEALANFLQGLVGLDWTMAQGEHQVGGEWRITRFNYSRN